MQSLMCVRHGPPEDLVLMEQPSLPAGRGEIRIEVRAAGVNFPDSLIIRDLYQVKPPLPFAPGSEVAGIVDLVGEGVDNLQPGDRVAALTGFGGFSEQVVVPAGHALRIPNSMPFDTAAGFILTYATSHHALKQRARLQPGETLLVLGAAGGVGLAAIEIGKALGARVIAAASTAEKLELAQRHGADAMINYSEGDLREAIKAATDGRGPDVIYDPVGDRFTEPAFRSIAWGGRYLVVGFAAGEIPRLPLNLPLIKGAAIIGVFWGAFTAHEPETHRENMAELLDWYRQGRLKPHISGHFPLAEGGKAIRALMERQAKGKLIVTI